MSEDLEVLAQYHKSLLEALRHREQEIFLYLTILGPSLGGFIWLLYKFEDNAKNKNLLIITTFGIWILFLLGALYSIALGYNYRYITLQLRKLEKELGIKDKVLNIWSISFDDWKKEHTICYKIPWCGPPEVIKWFWLAFIFLTLFTMIIVIIYTKNCIMLVGLIFALIALISPITYGCKIHYICDKETEKKDSNKIE
ncbi:MAG: hypothetical protein AB7I96_06205 [Candidatus Dadabacteria bacterium]